MKITSMKFPGITEAIILTLGLAACGPTSDQLADELRMPSDTAEVAMADDTPVIAFDVSATADSATISSSFSGANPSLAETTDKILITCSLRVDNPHKSHHVPGAVNVEAIAQCSSTVSGISMMVGLARNGVVLTTPTFRSAGKAFLKGNAAAPCVSGTYQGAAAATVIFPPGYIPSTGTLNGNSSRLPIGC